MTLVSPRLVEKYVTRSELLNRAWKVLTEDKEIQGLLRFSNVNAVKRLLYNDHGPVHAAIVAGSALEIFELLLHQGYEPSSMADGTVNDIDEARLIVLLGAYLHDIGNAVHRRNHELIGVCLASNLLRRILPKILKKDFEEALGIALEVMHAIYATAMDVEALTLEASIVKVADATDMAEGRARLPYRKGKSDIHALSALAIKSVEILPGEKKPLRIMVVMDGTAGFFQIEEVMLPKIKTSKLRGMIEILPILLSHQKSKELGIIYA